MTIFSVFKYKQDCLKIAALAYKWEGFYERISAMSRKLRFKCDYSDCNTEDEKIFKDEMLVVVDGIMEIVKDLQSRFLQPALAVMAMPICKMLKIKDEDIRNPIIEFNKGWDEIKRRSELLNTMVKIWANKEYYEITISKDESAEEAQAVQTAQIELKIESKPEKEKEREPNGENNV